MKNSTISLRISEELKQSIVERAKELNVSTSEYIISAVESKLTGKGSAFADGTSLAESIGQLNRFLYKNRSKCSEDSLKEISSSLNAINENIISIYLKRGQVLWFL